MRPWVLLSPFSASETHSFNFYQLSVQPQEISSNFRVATGPFVNCLCCHWTFCQLFVLPWAFHQFLSTFNTGTGPSINFPCGSMTFCQVSVLSVYFLSAFCTTAGPSVNFRHLSPDYLLSTFCAAAGPSVNIPCCSGAFCQLLSPFCAAKEPPITFPCGCRIFPQLFVQPQNLPPNSCAATGPSVDLCQRSVPPLDLPSTLRLAVGPSFNFCQLSVQLHVLPSTFPAAYLSINFPCCRGIFRQLPSAFCAAMIPSINFYAAEGPSVNFCQLSVQPQGLATTFHLAAGPSVNILCGCRTF